MGYISSTCKKLTPVTNTNGSHNPNLEVTFDDPEGTSFTMLQPPGNFGYQGLRTNSKYKYFRMTYEWRSTNGGYLGSFWGNTSATDMFGGAATGYKTVHYPVNSTQFTVRLRDTLTNQDRDQSGPIAPFNQNDGNWHNTVCEVRPYCVRQSVDGFEMLSSLHNDTRSIVATVGDDFNTEGYCGIIFYTGQYEIRNFRVEPLELNTEWEHFATYTDSVASSQVLMSGILDRNEVDYHTIKIVIERIRGETSVSELNFRYTNSSNTAYTSAYYGNIHEVSYASNTHIVTGTRDNASNGVLWVDNWENASGGQHGEVTIYNYGTSDFVINNNTVDKVNIYRPILHSTLVGFDQNTGYARQDANMRHNVDLSADSYSGMVLYYGTGNVSADYIIHVYGQRGPRA